MSVEGLGAASRVLLADVGRRRSVRRGTVLFRQDNESDSVLLVEHGLLRVSVVSQDGTDSVLALRGSGELVGEFGAITARRRSATVVALTDSTVVVIASARFRSLLRQFSGLACDVLSLLVTRVDESDRRRLEVGTCTVSQRLARFLGELAATHGTERADGGVEIAAQLTQEELGSAIGATRESVSRALAELRDDGLLSTARRRITILAPTRLDSYLGT